MIDVELLPAQGEFCMSAHPYPAISGGLGSGKTEAEIYRCIAKMLQYPGVNTLIGMPTYDLLKMRAMPGAEEVLIKLDFDYTLNKSDYFIELTGYGKLYFRSFDRPARWVAFEVGHTVLDELDTMKPCEAEVIWRKATERTRQKYIFADGSLMLNTIGVVTTPDQGINGFVCKKWGGNGNSELKNGYHLIFADTRDNHHLPPGYYDQIMSNYDPLLAEMYTQGKFVSLTRDKVYHYFSRSRHHTDRTITADDKLLHVGVDFNVGGCCATCFIIEDNMPVGVDEFVSHDTRDIINNLHDRYNGKEVIVYPDSSGGSDSTNASASDIEMIGNAGFMIDCPSKNPFVRDRINAFNGLLSHNRFRLNTSKMPMLTMALESQGYDDKGKPEKFNAHPAIDDWVDGAGYFISQRFPIVINSVSVSKFAL